MRKSDRFSLKQSELYVLRSSHKSTQGQEGQSWSYNILIDERDRKSYSHAETQKFVKKVVVADFGFMWSSANFLSSEKSRSQWAQSVSMDVSELWHADPWLENLAHYEKVLFSSPHCQSLISTLRLSTIALQVCPKTIRSLRQLALLLTTLWY